MPAGQTVRLAHFTILASTRAAAEAAANTLVGQFAFGGQAAAFLTPAEIASLANFQFPAPAQVVGRNMFYNQSYFDGNDAAAGAEDDNAIATDKTALLPGGTATLANYTSYSRGLNGIMVDVQGLADPAHLDATHFQFRVGNTNTPSNWPLATVLPSVTVRANTPTAGVSRVTLIWPDGAIAKQWLQVLVKAGAVTGLATPDVFYFGNAVGESGNSAANAFVDGMDFAGARDNPHSMANRVMIDDAYDYNRDSFVDGTDLAIARDNNTNLLTALKLITMPSAALQEAAGLGPVPGAEGEAMAPPQSPLVQVLDRVQAQHDVLPFKQDRSRDQERERTPAIERRDVRPRQAASLTLHRERSELADVGMPDLESVLNDLASDVAGAWTKTL